VNLLRGDPPLGPAGFQLCFQVKRENLREQFTRNAKVGAEIAWRVVI
jgi:hypothetical protein